ncbi:thioredoxin family protein [Serpentinicella alkaliphila]|uniref:Thioredoxin-like protein n=1 Tax=Serpentinicella alkaliphila TaxID=1734049 RepID=A0A4R2TV27_9FIRM|nr:thioredoxin family protein [Serpentinicella alkaliphila]QUH26994.1 thioredoxin family protein [Serpentinicella alkaliphila]TCQ01489.1 thioredoxin-like protein [Serpentinicella alkaliphila]
MILKELFEKGVDFQTFINLDGDINRDLILNTYNNIIIDGTLINSIKLIKKRINVLSFAEIWCPDCKINVPCLFKLTEINSNIQMRIVPREGNEEVMEKYKYEGKIRIPTFVVLDEEFNELGAFIETPKTLKRVINTGNELQVIIAKRKYNKGGYSIDTIEEVLSIIV